MLARMNELKIPEQINEERGFYWDWDKQVTMRCWHELCLTRWPGWDEDSTKDDNEPYTYSLVCTRGEVLSSHRIAVKFDNMANFQFYYRDWTDSGLPYLKSEGERYRSTFYFQSRMDHQLFLHLIDGYSNV